MSDPLKASSVKKGLWLKRIAEKIQFETDKYCAGLLRDVRKHSPKTTPAVEDFSFRVGDSLLSQKMRDVFGRELSYEEELMIFLGMYFNQHVDHEFFPPEEDGSVPEFIANIRKLEETEASDGDHHYDKLGFEYMMNRSSDEKGFPLGRYNRKTDNVFVTSFTRTGSSERMSMTYNMQQEVKNIDDSRVPEKIKQYVAGGFFKSFNMYMGHRKTEEDSFKRYLAHELTHHYLDERTEGNVPGVIDEAAAKFTDTFMRNNYSFEDKRFKDNTIGRNSVVLGAYKNKYGYEDDPRSLSWMIDIIVKRAEEVQEVKKKRGKDFYPIDWVREHLGEISKHVDSNEDRYTRTQKFLEKLLPEEYYSELSDIQKLHKKHLEDLEDHLSRLRRILSNERWYEDLLEELNTELEFKTGKPPRKILHRAVRERWSLEKIEKSVKLEEKQIKKKEKHLLDILEDLETIRRKVKTQELTFSGRPSGAGTASSQVLRYIDKIEEEINQDEHLMERIEEKH